MEKKDKEKIDFKHNLRIYWNFVKKYKLLYVLLFGIIIVLEALKVFEKYLFKIILDNGALFSSGELARPDFVHILFIVMIVFLGSATFKFLGNWTQIHVINKLDSSVIFDLKRKFFNHIVHLDHNFHTTHKSGSLISRLGRGARAVERMTDFLIFNFFPLIIELIIVIAAFAYFDLVSSVVIFLMAVTFIAYSIFISSIQQDSNLKANAADDKEKGNIADIFTNIDAIKYFGKEDVIEQKYVSLSEDTKKKFLHLWGYFRWFDSGQVLILALGTFFLFFFSIRGFLNGNISIGTIAFIYASFLGLTGPLYGFVHSVRRFYEGMADFQALFEYEKIKNGIKDEEGAKEFVVKEGGVKFENVSFKYNDRGIIKNVSIDIKPGQRVALVGHSGSGKTTLVKLLYRFYDVNSGGIKIDGKDIREFKQESLRSGLSIVPQEAVLFDDTIFNNIAFSNPSASKEEVFRAIKFAQLDEFVDRLPKKENTIVGERGVKLSGGERQRVSIARAILANSKILVLDEATSSLDSRTEYDIQKGLKNLMKNRTSLIIAHRLSTIMHADKIIVMDRGKIVQEGKHSELIKKQGLYRELWDLQKGGYIE